MHFDTAFSTGISTLRVLANKLEPHQVSAKKIFAGIWDASYIVFTDGCVVFIWPNPYYRYHHSRERKRREAKIKSFGEQKLSRAAKNWSDFYYWLFWARTCQKSGYFRKTLSYNKLRLRPKKKRQVGTTGYVYYYIRAYRTIPKENAEKDVIYMA